MGPTSESINLALLGADGWLLLTVHEACQSSGWPARASIWAVLLGTAGRAAASALSGERTGSLNPVGGNHSSTRGLTVGCDPHVSQLNAAFGLRSRPSSP